MFRRHDGKVLVAIFVYRVIDQAQGSRAYWSQSDGEDMGVRHLNLEEVHSIYSSGQSSGQSSEAFRGHV